MRGVKSCLFGRGGADKRLAGARRVGKTAVPKGDGLIEEGDGLERNLLWRASGMG